MSAHDFMKRGNEICEYFPFMPRPRDAHPVAPRLHAPDDEDKIAILHNSCPRSWRDEQSQTNQLDLDLQELVRYYSTLKSIERDDGDKKNKGKKNKGRNNDNNKSKKNDEYVAPCPIHNGTHKISQCKVIQNE